jgi:hypothetical protein
LAFIAAVSDCAHGLLDGFFLFFFLDKKEIKNQEKKMLSTTPSWPTPAFFSGPRTPIVSVSYQQECIECQATEHWSRENLTIHPGNILIPVRDFQVTIHELSG